MLRTLPPTEPPGTGIPAAETGAPKGGTVSGETEIPPARDRKTRQMRAFVTDFLNRAFGQTGWWGLEGPNWLPTTQSERTGLRIP